MYGDGEGDLLLVVVSNCITIAALHEIRTLMVLNATKIKLMCCFKWNLMRIVCALKPINSIYIFSVQFRSHCMYTFCVVNLILIICFNFC